MSDTCSAHRCWMMEPRRSVGVAAAAEAGRPGGGRAVTQTGLCCDGAELLDDDSAVIDDATPAHTAHDDDDAPRSQRRQGQQGTQEGNTTTRTRAAQDRRTMRPWLDARRATPGFVPRHCECGRRVRAAVAGRSSATVEDTKLGQRNGAKRRGLEVAASLEVASRACAPIGGREIRGGGMTETTAVAG